MEQRRFDPETCKALTLAEYLSEKPDDGAGGELHKSVWATLMPVTNLLVPYSSEAETRRHIATVAAYLITASNELANRAIRHDLSKLESPEKEAFDRETPLLKNLVYGSDEYKASLERLGDALRHHYSNNTHHAEHYEDGVDGMDLYDLIEMLLDWKAASLRHRTGTFEDSLEINRERFKISDQLFNIFKNHTKRYL